MLSTRLVSEGMSQSSSSTIKVSVCTSILVGGQY